MHVARHFYFAPSSEKAEPFGSQERTFDSVAAMLVVLENSGCRCFHQLSDPPSLLFLAPFTPGWVVR